MSKTLSTGQDMLQGLYLAVNLYYNYTGKAQCMDIYQEATQDLGTMGWDYQVCSDIQRILTPKCICIDAD